MARLQGGCRTRLRGVVERVLACSSTSKGVVPGDVKEGHFVVYAMDGVGLRRLVVKLSYLEEPGFLRLLERAEEEFGFGREGLLVVPCETTELLRIVGKLV